MQSNPTLGNTLTGHERRDAIHIAILPAVAAEPLKPGQRVSVDADGVASASGKTIGIVDPFLRRDLGKGARFYVCLDPYTIMSLRHEWAHPDIDGPAHDTSRAWVEQFAGSVGLGYDTIMEGAQDYVEDRRSGGWGEYLVFGDLLEGESVPDVFWDHYEIITGDKVNDDHRGSFFSCSC